MKTTNNGDHQHSGVFLTDFSILFMYRRNVKPKKKTNENVN